MGMILGPAGSKLPSKKFLVFLIRPTSGTQNNKLQKTGKLITILSGVQNREPSV
jgi:hypothetical protein